MKVTIAILAVVGLAAAAPVHSVLRAQATSRSVLDGVYTDEQAKRGETTYSTSCASCHGPALAGTEMAPPLTGKSFLDNWTDTTVRSEEHTSELQSLAYLVCRLLLEKKKKIHVQIRSTKREKEA